MYYENKLIENIKFEAEIFEDTEFIDCEFRKCIIEDCVLKRCTFRECKFVECTIVGPKTKELQINCAEIYNCNLIGVHWNELMSTGRISEPIRKMSDCVLKYNTFVEMNFVHFDFSSNVIQESTFDECNLKESNFKGCQLNGTQYINCNLQKADFRETYGYQIDIMTNRLEGAKFSFPDAINLLNGLGIKID